ncbi:hypothetical protein F5Y15DRAFT_329060 [Xylariaceae sp. FL0016]|nr:hypothetical protein F5Y15DRAFT_329060 [Xylariaceae sp. FL0016]
MTQTTGPTTPAFKSPQPQNSPSPALPTSPFTRTQTLTESPSSISIKSIPSPASTRSWRGRLFRTSSGNLATRAKIRRRKELNEELLAVILDGIEVTDVEPHSVAMDMDEAGRWRIVLQGSSAVN